MKAILSILTTFAGVMLIASEPPISKIKHDKLTAFTADDSTALVLSSEGTAIVGNDGVVGIVKGNENYYIMVGYGTDTLANGISVIDSGNIVLINAPKIIISRKTFTSHEAADAALAKGEEYYLQGDRLVYRKP